MKVVNFLNSAEMEEKWFDKRYEILHEEHPMSLQVNLNTGVANGLIVVRTEEDAAAMIYKSLTNSHEYVIDEESDDSMILIRENNQFRG
ncbi:MAG: hypothetical protein IPL83_08240 [Bdellovibrionales bacterium]|nr:hypothetical protein [Bdellovibrionales bacterium]